MEIFSCVIVPPTVVSTSVLELDNFEYDSDEWVDTFTSLVSFIVVSSFAVERLVFDRVPVSGLIGIGAEVERSSVGLLETFRSPVECFIIESFDVAELVGIFVVRSTKVVSVDVDDVVHSIETINGAVAFAVVILCAVSVFVALLEVTVMKLVCVVKSDTGTSAVAFRSVVMSTIVNPVVVAAFVVTAKTVEVLRLLVVLSPTALCSELRRTVDKEPSLIIGSLESFTLVVKRSKVESLAVLELSDPLIVVLKKGVLTVDVRSSECLETLSWLVGIEVFPGTVLALVVTLVSGDTVDWIETRRSVEFCSFVVPSASSMVSCNMETKAVPVGGAVALDAVEKAKMEVTCFDDAPTLVPSVMDPIIDDPAKFAIVVDSRSIEFTDELFVIRRDLSMESVEAIIN